MYIVEKYLYIVDMVSVKNSNFLIDYGNIVENKLFFWYYCSWRNFKRGSLTLKTSDFKFDLPQELIAQVPIEDRASSRLMVLDKETGNIEHKVFRDIIEYLNPGDCLVLNNTRVIPARLIGEKLETGGKIEFLLLKRTEEDTWQALVKPGKRAKVGTKFSFGNGKLIGEVVDLSDEGSRIIKFHYDGIFEEILDELGNMPLPPYITARLDEKERYQTVYSKHNGSSGSTYSRITFYRRIVK